jgi:hypothetical protein
MALKSAVIVRVCLHRTFRVNIRANKPLHSWAKADFRIENLEGVDPVLEGMYLMVVEEVMEEIVEARKRKCRFSDVVRVKEIPAENMKARDREIIDGRITLYSLEVLNNGRRRERRRWASMMRRLSKTAIEC